jgi:predicted O-linked N-acetylglucosamine transferase (SPINDLY family)
VLTCIGETFAGRVAASLLEAIRLPELVARSPEEYEESAVDLALDPSRLAAVRQKLAANRLTTPLFDTRRFARSLEAAYAGMYRRYQAGSPPDHLPISG